MAQHVETLREYVPTKHAKATPWKVTVHRRALRDDVLRHFSEGFHKQKLFRSTCVTFIDTHGRREEGEDHGGLTVEMYSSFYREVCRHSHLPMAVTDHHCDLCRCSRLPRASLKGQKAAAASACCPSRTRPPSRSRRSAACSASEPPSTHQLHGTGQRAEM